MAKPNKPKKLKVNLSPLVTQSDYDSLVAYAASIVGVSPQIVGVVTDSKGKHIKFEMQFPHDTDMSLLAEAREAIKTSIAADGTVIYPLGGSSAETFETAVTDQIYTTWTFGPAGSELAASLIADAGSEFQGSADGDGNGGGKALELEDTATTGDASNVHNNGGEIYAAIPAVAGPATAFDITFDAKNLTTAKDVGTVSGTRTQFTIKMFNGATPVGQAQLFWFDQPGGTPQLNLAMADFLGGSDSLVLTTEEMTTAYRNMSVTFEGGAALKIWVDGVEKLSLPLPSPEMTSVSMSLDRVDRYGDANPYTQPSILIDNFEMTVQA